MQKLTAFKISTRRAIRKPKKNVIEARKCIHLNLDINCSCCLDVLHGFYKHSYKNETLSSELDGYIREISAMLSIYLYI